MEKLDILVANAGVNRDNLFVQLRDEDWDKVIAVNLTATFRLARAAVYTHDASALGPRDRHLFGGRRLPAIRDRATTRLPKPAWSE